VVAVATVLPLFAAKHLPFTDLPEHVAVVSALVHRADPSFHVAEHYAFAFPRSQYVLFHVVAAALTFVVRDPEIATRLLLAAVGLAYPFSLRALLGAMGVERRLAVFGALVFWNRSLAIGFLPFAASVPVLVYGLALVVADAESPSPRRRVGLGALALALFYLHVASFIELVVMAAVMTFALGPPRSLERRLASLSSLLWLVPSLLGVATWLAFGRLSIGTESLLRSGEISYMSPRESLVVFPMWIHDVWRSHLDDFCALAWWGSLLAMVVSSVRGPTEPLRALGLRMLPLACAVTVYFAMPYQAGVGVMLNVRLAPLLALFAVLPLRPAPGRWTEVPLAVVAAATIVMSLSSALEIAACEREEIGDLDALLARARPGSNVIALNFDNSSNHAQFAPWLYAVSYHRVRTGGVTSFSFTSLAHWPMRYVPGGEPPAKDDAFWAVNPCVFRNAEDGPFYDYVLVRGATLPFQDEPPGPRFRFVASTRAFSLYEKTTEPPWPSWPTRDRGPCRRRALALPAEPVTAP
jgi:hypothetical protein